MRWLSSIPTPASSTSARYEAALLLPSFFYCFNIADFKRRNSHLGHLVGDADIAEFEGLIATTARADGTAQRVSGDRWLMLSRSNVNDRIQAALDHYQLAQQFVSGWRIRASRAGQKRVAEAWIETVIRRAVRCLYTEVANEAELAPAIAALEKNDWALPVNRPHPLSAVPALPPHRFRCRGRNSRTKPAT